MHHPSSGVGRARPRLEALEARNAPACLTFFDPDGGQLWIACDGADDRVVLSSHPGGAILLNGEAIPGNPTVLNTGALVVYGGDGSDWLDTQHLEGYDGSILLYGAGGDDVVLGGAAGGVLAGGDGNDRIGGGAGDDFLFGGAGNDHLYGGAGFDVLFGQEDNDYLVGGMDGVTDLVSGGAGRDIFELDYACFPQPEERVLDFEHGQDTYVTVVYIVDPCGHF